MSAGRAEPLPAAAAPLAGGQGQRRAEPAGLLAARSRHAGSAGQEAAGPPPPAAGLGRARGKKK